MTPSPIRLSELAEQVKNTVQQAFANRAVWVIADVTNHTFKEGKGHHYFRLSEKDEQSNSIRAQFDARSWGAGTRRILDFETQTGQRFGNGLQVLARVLLEYHPQYGLQLELTDIDPAFSLGLIEQQRQATLQLLLDKNPDAIQLIRGHYRTRNQAVPFRPVLQHIAVISARDSAGLQDFRHTLEHNPYGYRFAVEEFHTQVQGDAHAVVMRSMLVDIFRSGKPYDAVVLIRGGGADTDFLIYDNYAVCQAIARFPIPVITGIGHLKNTTIADLMAHTSVKTPTQAAEFLITQNKAFEDRVAGLQKNVLLMSQQRIARAGQHLQHLRTRLTERTREQVNEEWKNLRLAQTLCIHRSRNFLHRNGNHLQRLGAGLIHVPAAILQQRQTELKHAFAQLQNGGVQVLKHERQYLAHFRRMVKLMAPENLLQKGFALVRYQGKVVADASGITAGEPLEVWMRDAVLHTTVNQKNKRDESSEHL